MDKLFADKDWEGFAKQFIAEYDEAGRSLHSTKGAEDQLILLRALMSKWRRAEVYELLSVYLK